MAIPAAKGGRVTRV